MPSKRALVITFVACLLVFELLALLSHLAVRSSQRGTWPADGDYNDRGRALNLVRHRLRLGMSRSEVIAVLGEPNITCEGQDGGMAWEDAKDRLGKEIDQHDTVFTYFVYIVPSSWFEDVIPDNFDLVFDRNQMLKYVMTDTDMTKPIYH